MIMTDENDETGVNDQGIMMSTMMIMKTLTVKICADAVLKWISD